MPPSNQKALVLHEIGTPLRLETNRPVPSPDQDQVLVKVHVAGLNPHDQKSRDLGLFVQNLLPAVLSNDVVGVVVEAGSSVSDFKLGDRIVGQANWVKESPQSGLQEYAVLDAEHASHIPDSVSNDEAATLPTNTLAPVVALFEPSKLGFVAPWAAEGDYNRDTILVIGGASACGKFATQFTKLAGIGRIVVLGGDEAELKGFGATKVLSRFGEAEEVRARIQAAVGDDLRFVLDCVNAPEQQHIGINALSLTSGGKLARLRRTGTIQTELVREGAKYELVDIFGSSFEYPDLCKPFWKALPEYLVARKIRPLASRVIDGLDSEAVNKALDDYRDGRKVLKANVHVS
ncbi:Enoyl LovC [Cyphellophora attinorum]|uniref:Enoyl LovC n=1 Tax=Cyphellophora attinorum TaxID=1664694 RepID=A0A0N0NIJ9_9EURO|nr:Enoyl LovC [Phialophora attinorum]KPI35921.1 Enoyl LovC [Phialophora attinorum]